jgi:hypothetical protein
MSSGQRHEKVGEHKGATTEVDDGTADSHLVREECERVLSHPLFSNSNRYSGLLKYIVDHTLDGQHDCLKERIIGIEVFGRPPDYNTSTDSTVRGAVTEVRKRLHRYYEDPAHQNELRIDLPAGSYVAGFIPPHRRLEEPALKVSQRVLRCIYVAVPMAAVVLLFAFWGANRFLSTTPAIDEFWAPMVNYQGTVLIALGTPQEVGPQPTPREASTEAGIPLSKFISEQANYPISELNPANSINSFLARKGSQSVIRLAKSTTLADLQGAPAIVLGSYPNPWAMRLGSGLHFRFQQDSTGLHNWVEDSNNPGNRSWVIDLNSPFEQVASEYALITRAVDATTGQWWIGLGGTTVLGTIGAQRMLMDPAAMSALSAQLPRGWQRKNLQIVVEFKMVDGSLGASRVVATYLW